MDDFIRLDHVFLISAKPYSVKGEGQNAGKVYEGWTYNFLLNGKKFKLSSDKVNLSSDLNASSDPVAGSLRVGLKPKGEFLAPVLIGFDVA